MYIILINKRINIDKVLSTINNHIKLYIDINNWKIKTMCKRSCFTVNK